MTVDPTDWTHGFCQLCSAVCCRYVYWTEWGDNARVARTSITSGTVETILSASSIDGLDEINALSIDPSSKKLYIGDASGHVFESNLDGKFTCYTEHR